MIFDISSTFLILFLSGHYQFGVEVFSDFVCAVFCTFGLEPVGSLVLKGGFFNIGGGYAKNREQ